MSRIFTTFLEKPGLQIRRPGRVYFEEQEDNLPAGPASPTVSLDALSFGG